MIKWSLWNWRAQLWWELMPSVTLASGVYGLNRFIVLWVPQIVFKNTNKLLYPLLSVVKCFFLFFKQQICHFGLFMNISCLLSCILFLKSVEKAQERGEALPVPHSAVWMVEGLSLPRQSSLVLSYWRFQEAPMCSFLLCPRVLLLRMTGQMFRTTE